jgi:molybdopterin-guanine dinucleotide biosynthesis protein A
VVVVGPDRVVPPGVVVTVEDPPGGGPAAAIAAGVAALPELPVEALVALFAADLPAIGPETVGHLAAAAGRAGAVLVDDRGRRQWLAGVWRYGPLVEAVRRRSGWHGRSVRELLEPLTPDSLPGHEQATADVDTPDDWRRAAAPGGSDERRL